MEKKDAELKFVDIRQLREEKPKLGWLADLRFGIFHNHRKIAELEPAVLLHLQGSGPVKVVTRDNFFEFSLEDGRVSLTIREGRRFEGLPFQSAPAPVQLFCNEAIVLHKNQQEFWGLTDDELRQVFREFHEAAPPEGLYVTKGRHGLVVQLDDQKLHFRPQA